MSYFLIYNFYGKVLQRYINEDNILFKRICLNIDQPILIHLLSFFIIHLYIKLTHLGIRNTFWSRERSNLFLFKFDG